MLLLKLESEEGPEVWEHSWLAHPQQKPRMGKSRGALVLRVVAIPRAQQATKEAWCGPEDSSFFSSFKFWLSFSSHDLLCTSKSFEGQCAFCWLHHSSFPKWKQPWPWEKQNQGGESQETERPGYCPLHPIMRGYLKAGWKGSLVPSPTCICQLCGLGRLSPFCGPISLPGQRKGRWLKVMPQKNSASQEKID